MNLLEKFTEKVVRFCISLPLLQRKLPGEPSHALGHLHQALVKTKFAGHDAMEDAAALGRILDAANISTRLLSKEAHSFKCVMDRDQYL